MSYIREFETKQKLANPHKAQSNERAYLQFSALQESTKTYSGGPGQPLKEYNSEGFEKRLERLLSAFAPDRNYSLSSNVSLDLKGVAKATLLTFQGARDALNQGLLTPIGFVGKPELGGAPIYAMQDLDNLKRRVVGAVVSQAIDKIDDEDQILHTAYAAMAERRKMIAEMCACKPGRADNVVQFPQQSLPEGGTPKNPKAAGVLRSLVQGRN